MAFISNAPSDLDLTKFVGSLNSMGGIAKLARFIVTVTPVGNNPLSQKYDTNQFKGIMYACFQAEFPGRGFQTLSTRYYGPEQIYPFNTEYSKCSLTFMCRNNSVERMLFDDWQNLFDNPDWVTADRDFALMSAIWFWNKNKLNVQADAGDIKLMTKKINGGYIGLEDRIKHYNEAIHLLT